MKREREGEMKYKEEGRDGVQRARGRWSVGWWNREEERAGMDMKGGWWVGGG
jgi:hypothetical protein